MVGGINDDGGGVGIVWCGGGGCSRCLCLQGG